MATSAAVLGSQQATRPDGMETPPMMGGFDSMMDGALGTIEEVNTQLAAGLTSGLPAKPNSPKSDDTRSDDPQQSETSQSLPKGLPLVKGKSRRSSISVFERKSENDNALNDEIGHVVNRWLIDPRTSMRVGYWDAVASLALVFTAIVTPFEVALIEDDGVTALFVINRLIDLIFIFDIGLQFFLITERGTGAGTYYLTKQKDIATHYLNVSRRATRCTLARVSPFLRCTATQRLCVPSSRRAGLRSTSCR